MITNHFENLNDQQLLDAYEEYKKVCSGGQTVPGAYQAVAAALEQTVPGKGNLLAANQLLGIMAHKWYLELRPVGQILERDDDVWLIQYDEVKEARVVRVLPDGEDFIYWIQPYDTELYWEYHENQLGTQFFLTELAANRYLEENT